MQLPPELQELLQNGPNVAQVRSVTIFAADRDDGTTSYICRGTVMSEQSESGIQLPTPKMAQLSQADVFFLITAYLQAILMNGSKPKGPQLEIARGGL